MLIDSSTNMVESVEARYITSSSGDKYYAEILHFVGGKVLVISHNAIALYKSAAAISDPLGNGIIKLATLPDTIRFNMSDTPWVVRHISGFIELIDQYIILILPNSIRLYRGKEDALRNSNIILDLPFDGSDSHT